MPDHELPEAERFRFSVADGNGKTSSFNAYAQDSAVLIYRHDPRAADSHPVTIGVPRGYAEGQSIELCCRRAIQRALDVGLFENWPAVEVPIERSTLAWDGALLRL
ncbi:hypothetical protein [Pandoraea morbifera]|uniref:hypothetical protein n=1 Tax=Pandoraea morbifera TaxID=2508300 RepID=UPI0012428177|nr:hypothetical protein [Pandoraea morbifera]